MRSPIRLVRNSDAARMFDTFLISSVVTVLITRLYLHITGYPQIGGDSVLHIAHMLPGGILMLAAILILIGSINRSSRQISACIGGVGFGLFWDELGKFITKDNDYFFQPTIGLIYISFIGLYLLTRYIIRRTYHPHDYLANVMDLAMEGVIGELDPREYHHAKELLGKADKKHPMYEATKKLLEVTKPTKDYRPFIIDRMARAVHKPFHAFVQKPWFSRVLLRGFYAYSIGLVITLVLLVAGADTKTLMDIFLNPVADSNLVAAVAAGVAAIFILWGTWYIQTNRIPDALRKFETALLINLFVTQVFLFFSYQFSAILGLALVLVLLVSVRILLSETK
jgi:hypothetical protein